MRQQECYRIKLQTVGETAEGFITIAEQQKQIPFSIKRIFWTYATPGDVIRGGHAHHETEMALFAIHGSIRLQTETASGMTELWELDTKTEGVYMPPYTWHTMEYSDDAIQLVMASTLFSEEDYIRDYNAFRTIISGPSKEARS
jgi:dTDP-4-dehydrorhamnose 3,5-epimerase-like enzyme